MENGILNEIGLFLNKKDKDDSMISLYEIVEFMNDLKFEYENKNQKLIRKMNHKLGKNLNFFNYEIKKINFTENIELFINHELEMKIVSISKNGEIITNIKNKELFKNILIDEIKELVKSLTEFLDLIDLKIKTKVNNLNININKNSVEIFMHKSKNWITMGKAFSLKYDIYKNSFIYEVDNINLEKFLNHREKELFNSIYVKKTLLTNEFQLRYEIYLNSKLESKPSFISNFVNKIRNLMKKK